MSPDNRVDRGLSAYRPPIWLVLLAVAFIVIGVAGLVVSFAVSPSDSWLWLVVWFVIYGGIANGVLVWAAAFRTAQARWTFAISRIAHSLIAFVPAIAVALVVLLVGIPNYVPWIAHPALGKEAWLNVPFMVIRDIIALGALWILYFLLVRWSLSADEKVRNGQELTRRDHFRLNVLSAATVLTYSVSVSIVAYDFIMSLSPRWVSTMFAPYIFVTDAYAGMAVLVILCALLRKPLGVEQYIGPERFHDMGNLMLGFALFIMGIFFAQYVTIWYENLPEETFFLIPRYLKGQWSYLGWASFITAYAAPFLLLQSRMIKLSPRLMTGVSILAILGFSLERYVLVVPSLRPDRQMLFPVGALGLLAFLGVFMLTVAVFVSRYPPISAADEALDEANLPEVVS